MDRVFQGLAGLLRKISQGQSLREIPQSSPTSPWKSPSIPPILLGVSNLANSSWETGITVQNYRIPPTSMVHNWSRGTGGAKVSRE